MNRDGNWLAILFCYGLSFTFRQDPLKLLSNE